MDGLVEEDAITLAFVGGSRAQRLAILERLPPSSFKDLALLQVGTAEQEVVALETVAMDHALANPALAANLAAACYRVCVHHAASSGSRSFITGASRCVSTAARAFRDSGNQVRALDMLTTGMEWLNGRIDTADLRFDRVETLIELQRLDDATGELQELAPMRNGLRYRELSDRIDSLRDDATKLPDPRPVDEQLSDARTKQLDHIVDMISAAMPRNDALIQALRARVAAEPREARPAQAESASAAVALMEGYLGISGDVLDSPAAVRARLRAASLLCLRPPDHDQLVEAVPGLFEVIEHARTHGLADELREAYWILALCLERLDRRAGAIDALWSLHREIDRARLEIADPLHRIGLLTRFPNLYPVLCELAALEGRDEELFAAIEASKGRVVSEYLARHGKPDLDGGSTVTALRAATTQLDAHYLTFFVDENCVRAALMTRTGRLHSASVPITREIIRRYARLVDPETWGKQLGLFGANPADFVARLSPLVQWLAPLVASGELRTDDHICYCADEELHLIPLHVLELDDAPIVDRFSLSRVHSAGVLVERARTAPRRPDRYASFEIPARDDPPPKAEMLGALGQWLDARLAGVRVRGASADLEAFRRTSLSGCVVHIAAHGTFPHAGAAGIDPNPYTSSGILLAHDDHLPLRSSRWDAILSPRVVVEQVGPSLADSHVTLMACVSGLAKEGRGGDALGLDWALAVVGAASVLSTHWNIEAPDAVAFTRAFYERWLGGASRAVAWRETIRTLRATTSVSVWAAFSLSGEFR